MENNFYVYLLIDPRTNLPFYVGKGKGNRHKNHKKEFEEQIQYYTELYNSPQKKLSLKHHVFSELKDLNLETKFQIINNLKETDAHLLEEALIAWFGRKICGNGILTNLLSGGKNGHLYFNDQTLVEIYRRGDLLKLISNYPKTSTKWIAKTLFFYDRNLKGYPFKELGIDWLYQYHGCCQQFALLVINILNDYDAVITPFYWIRKVQQKSFKEDKTYIMKESLDFIDTNDFGTYQLEDFDKYISDYKEFLLSNKNQ